MGRLCCPKRLLFCTGFQERQRMFDLTEHREWVALLKPLGGESACLNFNELWRFQYLHWLIIKAENVCLILVSLWRPSFKSLTCKECSSTSWDLLCTPSPTKSNKKCPSCILATCFKDFRYLSGFFGLFLAFKLCGLSFCDKNRTLFFLYTLFFTYLFILAIKY